MIHQTFDLESFIGRVEGDFSICEAVGVVVAGVEGAQTLTQFVEEGERTEDGLVPHHLKGNEKVLPDLL